VKILAIVLLFIEKVKAEENEAAKRDMLWNESH